MSILRHSSSDFEAAAVAQRLRVPVDAIVKLRRVLDPGLSFEEHNSIFPLDLGPVWDIEAFSAPKTNYQHFHSRPLNDEILSEWGPIFDQCLVTLDYGLMGRFSPLCASDDSSLYAQTLVSPETAQIGPEWHADGANELLCFRDFWKPPTEIILIVRDVEPLTLFAKTFDTVPWDLVREPDKENSIPNHLVFDDAGFTKLAEREGKLIKFPEGHVIAITNRTLHAGQIAKTPTKQTWFRAEATLLRMPLPA